MSKSINFRILSALFIVAAAGTSCLSGGEYDTKEIDTGFHLAPGGLSVPIAVLEKTFIKEYLDKIKIKSENVEFGPDALHGGAYSFRYTGNEIRRSMEGFVQSAIDLQSDFAGHLSPRAINVTGSVGDMTQVDLSAATINFDLGLPDFDFAGSTAAEEIAPENPANQWPAELDYLKGATFTQSQIDLMTTAGANPITNNDSPLTDEPVTKKQIVIDVNIPAEISSISSVSLTDNQNSAEGALITMSVDMGGLQPVNGGTIIKNLRIELPERYTLVAHPSFPATSSMSTGSTHNNILTATDIDMAQNKTFDFKLYVSQADLSDLVPAPSAQEGMNYISTLYGGQSTEEIIFSISYELSLKPGTISSNPVAPSVKIVGKPVFKDATFSTNQISQSYSTEFALEQFKIEGIPSNITKVDKIAFVDGNNSMTLSMSELPLPFADVPTLDMTFPSIFVFADSHTEPDFTRSTNTFHLTTDQLEAGYVFNMASIEFGAGQGIPDSEGVLDFSDYGNVEIGLDHTFSPATFTYSTDIATLPQGQPQVGIAATTLEVDLGASDLNISGVGNLSEPVRIDLPIGLNLPELPQDVTVSSIESVSIAPVDSEGAMLDGEPVELELSIDITEPMVSSFSLDNVRIVFPNFVDVAPHPDIKNNVYTKSSITIDATQSSQTLATFVINGFKNIEIVNGQPEAEDDLQVDFRVNAPDGASLDLSKNMVITPRVTIPNIKVKRVAGEFSLPLGEYLDADQIEPVDLSQVFDYLGEDTAVIPGLVSPIVKVEFNNPTGIVTSGTVNLTPRNKDGIAILPGSGVFPVTVPLRGGLNKLYITKGGSQSAPDGYTGVDADFTQLMRQIPHTIDVSFDGGQGKAGSYIDLSEDGYEFVINFSVEVPLAFDDSMSFTYDLEQDGLNEIFSGLDEVSGANISQILICAEFESNFPFKIAGSTVRFYDTDGEESILETNIDKIFEGPSPSTGSKTSTMVVSFIIPEGGDLKALSKIDKVKMSLPLESTALVGAYSSIDENSYIEGRVWGIFPEGGTYHF